MLPQIQIVGDTNVDTDSVDNIDFQSLQIIRLTIECPVLAN